jgi:glycerol kinase
MTVLGAAVAAGLAANVWKDTSQLPRATTKIYEPQIQPDGMYIPVASVCNG